MALRTSDWGWCFAVGAFSNFWYLVIVMMGRTMRPMFKKEEQDVEQLRVAPPVVSPMPPPAAITNGNDLEEVVVEAKKEIIQVAGPPDRNFLIGMEDVCVAKLWQQHFEETKTHGSPVPGSRSRSPSPSANGGAGRVAPAPLGGGPERWRPTALKKMKSQNSIPSSSQNSSRSHGSVKSTRSSNKSSKAISKKLTRAFSNQDFCI